MTCNLEVIQSCFVVVPQAALAGVKEELSSRVRGWGSLLCLHPLPGRELCSQWKLAQISPFPELANTNYFQLGVKYIIVYCNLIIRNSL